MPSLIFPKELRREVGLALYAPVGQEERALEGSCFFSPRENRQRF